MPDKYYKGQGKLYISDRDPVTGKPTGGFRWLGNVPQLKVATETQETTHTESYTGEQLEDLVLYTQKKCSIMFTLEDFSRENLALALQGTPSTVNAVTVTDEPQVAVLGRSFKLNNVNISAANTPVVTGVGGTPVYAAGTDYVVSKASGLITVPAGSTIPNNGNVLVDYATAAANKVSTFTAPSTNRYLLFEGLNNADNKNPVIIEFFKVSLKPQKEWSLIQNDQNLSSLDIDGRVLFDVLQPGNTTDGQFMRVQYP